MDALNDIKIQKLPYRLPIGFIKKTNKFVHYGEMKSRPHQLIPIKDLDFNQKKILVTQCWHKGFWEDVVFENERIKNSSAFNAVMQLEELDSKFGFHSKEKRLGETLLETTILGYESMYERLLPLDTNNYPLPKITHETNMNIMDIYKDKTPRTFTLTKNVKIQMKIYKIVDGKEDLQTKIKAKTLRHARQLTPDFVGQEWLVKDKKSNIISKFMALPGNTNWNFQKFPVSYEFLPSLKPNNDEKKNKIKLTVTNNLKTYVNVYMVRSTEQLHYLRMIAPQATITMNECHVGYSFVATQGTAVFSDFQVLSSNYTEWSIGESIGPKGHQLFLPVFKTGQNNYIYYHVKREQDDTINPELKTFEQNIKIAEGTGSLYMILSQSNSTYFKVPQGKYKVSIVDPNGKKVLFAKGKLASQIKEPIPGTWKVELSVPTNTPMFFQLQTWPAKDPYETFRKTFEGDYPRWKDFVYRGLAAMIMNEHIQPWDGVLNEIVFKIRWLFKSGWNFESINEIKTLIDTLFNPNVPVSNIFPRILLVDANGEDILTRDLYSARHNFLYDYVAKYSKYNLSTVTPAYKEIFQQNLQHESIKLVSFGGHGGIEEIYGHSRPPGNLSPILTSADVLANPNLVENKIFHVFACGTCMENPGYNTLGRTAVVDGRAVAYIGYNEEIIGVTENINNRWQNVHDLSLSRDFLRWRDNLTYQSQYVPDCKILQALVDGGTVEEAVKFGKYWYGKLVYRLDYFPTVNGFVQSNRDRLGYFGNGDAKLA